jgi:hypothetical protein
VPTPTGGDIHVNVPLTNLSIAYFQSDMDFIADTVFPPVPVQHISGIYYTYDKGPWLRSSAKKRAPRTESAGTDWTVGQDTYATSVRAVHADIADQDRANQDRPVFDLDRDATNLISRDMRLRRELDWVETYFGTGKWTTTDQTGVNAAPAAQQFLQWDDPASTPIEDIEEQRLLMAQTTGIKPNVLVIGPQVYSIWKNHPQFIERIKYTQKGYITLDLIASLMDLDRIVVPMVATNNAEQGAADDIDFMYGKSALLAYAAPNPGLMQPSAGYSFEWTGYLGAETRGTRVSKFRMENLKADRVEIESAYDFKRVSGDLGVFFATAVA